ncbi:TPM domain-containing protein [Phytohabitans flavus]|uniref:Membrane protein n=1 Tax=Phytohabitans flavus TaxID=1076124 RepID=A0A6F8XVE4_9ACTN|nr:TPM domain-containing protein [Phytohabitans flavus]BCB77769.1 membrane protein [Phytohabitans flavus]
MLPPTHHRAARAVVAVVLAVLAGFALPAPARADGPTRLDGQITDKVGALDGREGEVRAALDRLRADGGLQLFVVYVRSFDGTPSEQWADQTATRSDFGRRDAVLAVATHDRSYAYAFDAEFPLTDTQLDVVATVAIEPALSANDWAGAAIAAADGYRAVLAGQAVPSPQIRPGEADPGGGGGASAWIAGALCLLVVAGGVVLVLWLLRRRRQRPPVPAGPSTAELTTRANDLLVELDNDLRASEQELALASGRYGAEATASYTAALESARQDVAEAFRLRMTLDETPGPDEATRRSTLEEIIRRCALADSGLDAESEAFDALRDLEARVEAEMAEQATRQEAVEARIPAASAALDAVRTRYVGPAATGIAGNVDQARRRLEFVTSVTRQATEALAEGDRPRAALAVRAAEEALGQAETLLDAVERARTDLDAAQAGIDTLLAEVESDLAAARATQPGTAALAAAITGAEQALAAVRAAVAGPTTDPLAATARLEEADAALDRELAEIRDAAERAARARALLDQALVAARAEVAAASDFIATRRGAVASHPRALLAQAQQHLARAEALAASNPPAALPEAGRASQLAAEAGRAAQSNVDQWSPPGIGGRGGGGTDVLLGVLLGGILSGGGGGGRPRGWGGGGFRGGGFGGSGSRARRTGGGRF